VFHDLRASGITWRIIRGDGPVQVQQAAGHADFATTLVYTREAEALAVGFGVVFAAFPASFIASPPQRQAGPRRRSR